jgi:hypothetical protein
VEEDNGLPKRLLASDDDTDLKFELERLLRVEDNLLDLLDCLRRLLLE